MAERRNDIGGKLTYVVLTAVITLMLSAFFYKTYGMAEGALEKSNTNERDIAVLKQCTDDIGRRLIGIDSKLDKLLQWNRK